ncbi:hypothetical protein PHYC_02301 [Phycisphaerales bacterium]|nr:hypothetical protein PHYC_02301 [Phycisphaerales bacterium]
MSEHDSNLEPPVALRESLVRGYTPPTAPSAIDAAVLAAARRDFDRSRRRRRIWLTAGPLAAAAGLALAVFVMWPTTPPPGGPRAGLLAAGSNDLNADGAIDMLDALTLARQVASGRGVDLNGDGVADSRDVDALARRAVRLDGGAS